MPVTREPDTGTAVLPGLPAAGWQARVAMLEVSARFLPGLAARGRFAVRAGTLDLAGRHVERMWVRADGPSGGGTGPALACRALLGSGVDVAGSTGLELRCTGDHGRARLTGELHADGVVRAVSLRVRLLDVRAERVLLWLCGPVRPPARRALPPYPRIQLAAEFTR